MQATRDLRGVHLRIYQLTGKRSSFINGGMRAAMVLREFIYNDLRVGDQLSLGQERLSPYRLTVSGRWHCSQQNLNHNLLCYQRRWANRSRYRIPASRNTTSRRFFLMENKFCLLE